MEHMRVVRRIAQSLCIILLLFTARALSAQKDEQRIRILFWFTAPGQMVLAGKAFNDILVKDGYNVASFKNQETPSKKTVAAAKRALAQQDGPSFLVGHSYGGAVITEAGTDPSVAGLVYVAATSRYRRERG